LDLALETEFDPRYGEPARLSRLVTRIVAENPSPFTFRGTSSYIVGERNVVVIDPGPDGSAHRQALVSAIAGREVIAILVTHSHRDHVEGVEALKREIDVPVLAATPRQRAISPDDGVVLDAGRDRRFVPDRLLADGARIAIDGATLEAVATPGHASDHLAFALVEENSLFSGDHVMGWSTTVVAPPDGHMGAYLGSLRLLLKRQERWYYPGHGGAISNGPGFVRALLAHRLAREQAIVSQLAAGIETIPDLVARIYQGLAPALVPAAGASVLAHLEHLIEQGRVVADADLSPRSRFKLTPAAR
jgi:glyoxylase-like metal-dependent hydrolase (beta-lactamase superfamily II)